MKKLVTALGLGLALSLGGVAIANDYMHQGHGPNMMQGEHMGKRMMKRMLSKLDLTDEQKDAIHALRDEAHLAMDELRDQATVSRADMKEQMKAIVQADSFDEQAFRELMAVKQAHRGEMAVIRAKMKHGVWHVLNEQQRDKMEQMMQKREQRRSERGFGRHGE